MSNDWNTHDPLGEVLYFLRMNSTHYSRCEFSAPWGMELPPFDDTVMFHVVNSGECWLEVEGREPLLLRAGDLALVPHGEGHVLVSTPGERAVALFDLPREDVSDRFEIIRQHGDGELVELICGTVHFDYPAAHRLISVLPRVIHIEADSMPDTGWVQSTLRYMAAEARELRPGGETVVTRLADILVIQAIRAWIERDPAAQSGWLGALSDRQIGHAIALVHRDPARDWTVAILANEVAMSRSAFAARFAEFVGEPPMQYITHWRMQLAEIWLREEGATVGEVANRLGYRSEAAFSRAFKRSLGTTPGAIRRQTHATTATSEHAGATPRR